MTSNHYNACLGIAVLLGMGAIVIVTTAPASEYGHFFTGLLLGTIFGQITLAAAWVPLGPGPFVARLPLSLAFGAMCLCAFKVNDYTHERPATTGLILMTCLCGQWMVAQIPLWIMTIAFGLELRHRDTTLNPASRRRQFGIGQLMIVTVVVAVASWMAQTALASSFGTFPGMWMTFSFLSMAATVTSVPLLVAALLPRYVVPAVAGAMLIVVVVTFWESALFRQILSGGGPGTAHFAWINFFTSAWTVAFALCVRLSGYKLTAEAHWEVAAGLD